MEKFNITDNIIYDEERLISVRNTKEFSCTNRIWNILHFNSRQNVGHLMALINNCNPKSYKEWVNYYLLYRSKEYNESQLFHSLIHKFADAARISNENSYKFIIIRVLYETWIGYQRESKTMTILAGFAKKNGLFALKSSDLDDIHKSIDYVLCYRGRPVLNIQAKSEKFLNTVNNAILENISCKQVQDYSLNKKQLYEEYLRTGVSFQIISYEDIAKGKIALPNYIKKRP